MPFCPAIYRVIKTKDEALAMVLAAFLGAVAAGYLYIGHLKRGLAIMGVATFLWIW